MIPISRTSKIAETILNEEEVLKNNLKLFEKQISKLLGIKVTLSITKSVGMGIGIESNNLKPQIRQMTLSIPEILQQIIIREFLFKAESINVNGRVGVLSETDEGEQRFHLNFGIQYKTKDRIDTLRLYVGDYKINKTTGKLEGGITQVN